MLYKTYDLLKSKKFGILLGFFTTGLMIFGSLTMNFAPERYAGLQAPSSAPLTLSLCGSGPGLRT
ncbi:MAG: hypothetical protein ACYSTI_12505 [Planctomycetota bacterium]|jgi:hypothetical protein